MLCDECKKRPATVHITKIINNQRTEYNLCAQCAAAKGEMVLAFEPQLSVHDILKGMLSYHPAADAETQPNPVCPACGMSFREFTHSGKIGCSACYQAFGGLLEPVLRRVQGGFVHAGKVPRRIGGKLHMQRRLTDLKKQLETLVCREEYEQAAKVRDAIRQLERQPGGPEQEEQT